MQQLDRENRGRCIVRHERTAFEDDVITINTSAQIVAAFHQRICLKDGATPIPFSPLLPFSSPASRFNVACASPFFPSFLTGKTRRRVMTDK